MIGCDAQTDNIKLFYINRVRTNQTNSKIGHKVGAH